MAKNWKVYLLTGGRWMGQHEYAKGDRSAVVKATEKKTGKKNGTVKVRKVEE